MRHRSVGGAAAVAVLLLGGSALAGCGGSDDDATDVTLPSSLSVTTTEPGVSTSSTSSPSTTTTGVPPTNPPADGAPVIVSVAVAPGACVAGTSTATVTFEADPEPPVRVFTVVLDGVTGGASASPTPITLQGIACDGSIHSALLIATGTDGRSSTQAVAFRAPRP